MKDPDTLPELKPETINRLRNTRPDAEGPKTAFLMDSLILQNKLLAEIWNTELSQMTGDYLNRYKGSATEPFRSKILETAEKNFIQKMSYLAEQKDYASIVELVNTLPANLEELRTHPTVSWATAESLRQLKQYADAIPYYEKSVARANTKIDQFRSQFIMNQVVSSALNSERAKANSARINQLQSKLKQTDMRAWEIWQSLTPQEKGVVFAENKDSFEQQIESADLTKTAPLILLEIFGGRLSSESTASAPAVNAKDKSAMGTERLIPLLVKMSSRFEKLGLPQERRKTKNILAFLDLKGTKVSKEAMTLWTNEVMQLAEELRQENNFLEAGRLYTQAGNSNNQWEGRAESLYKGGLLLYRAGRRDEAISAFQQAASDGSNLLYADLAKERLEQLK
jgi:tetratricopeptide (TPR) repeat protein